MGSLSFKNKNVKYLLCTTDVFTKYGWVKPLKDKKGKTVLSAFIEIKKGKTVLSAFIEIASDLIVNQTNYGLIKEDNFIIKLCNNS